MKSSPFATLVTCGSLWSAVILLFLLSAAAAHAQTYIFGRADFAVGSAPFAVTAGDFNGDGIVDLVSVNQGDNTVSVLLGNLDGTFSPEATYPTGPAPTAVVAGDFNRDGNLDLAVTSGNCVFDGTSDMVNCGPGSISILLGNGDGSFQPHFDYPTGVDPASVVAGDFNGDGKLDLAIANGSDSTLSVLFGNGDGTFQPQVVHATALQVVSNPESASGSLVIGDFNGDHKLDLAVACNQVVSVLLGNGDGTFQKHVDSGPGGFALAASDFNRDGNLDLVVNGNFGTNVLLGKGDGTFVINASYPGGDGVAAADLNGDGKPDLVIAGFGSNNSPVAVLLGNGDGTFQTAVGYATATVGEYVLISDLNGDGKLDLAVAGPGCGNYACGIGNPGGSVSVLLGFGDGTFVGETNYPFQSANPASQAISADFNGDGKPDIAAITSFPPPGPTPLGVYLGKGDGTFQAEVVTSLTQSAGGFAAGDFNGDGKADLATVFSNCVNNNCLPGDAVVLLGNGDGTFQPPVEYTVGLQPEYVAVGDFNGDGKPDLAVSNFSANTVSILLNKGDGTFQPHVDYLAGSNPGWNATGDFKGHGILDLVVVDSGANTVSILLGNGDGTFAPGTPLTLGAQPQAVVAADFNGDGKLDLAVTTQTTDQIYILLGKGDGAFQTAVAYPDNTEFAFPSAGDFNGDGKPDLIVGGANSPVAAILLGNGDGSFQPPIYNFLASGFLAVADFNQDGSPDLAGGNAYVLPTAVSVMLSAAFKGVSPAAVNFGSEGVGTTSFPRTITISNPSNVSFNVASIVASGNFSQTNDCAALASRAHCAVTVSFTPTATGLESGAITVTDSTKISPLAIPISGAGVNGPFLTPFPSRATFAPQAVGASSPPEVIMLVNTGNASLNMGGISITGADSSDFSQINNCGNSLSVAGSCTVKVTFTPSASGFRTASVSVSDTSPGSPQKILMFGTGAGFAISAAAPSPRSVSAGGSASTMVTVTSVAGFNQSVALSCGSITLNGVTATIAPPTCKFSPASVSNASGTSALTISTTGRSASLAPVSKRPRGLFYALSLPVLGLSLTGTRFRSSKKKLLAVLLVGLISSGLLFLAACGGGNSGTGGGGGGGGTPAGTYTITISGSAGSMVNTATVTLTVQ
jgi:hypothetical protein